MRAIRVATINHNDATKGRLRLELRRASDCGIYRIGYRWVSISSDGTVEIDDTQLDTVTGAMCYLHESYPTNSVWGLRLGR